MARLKLYLIAALVPLLAVAVWQWRAEIRNAAQWAVGFQQLEQALARQQAEFERMERDREREEALRAELNRELRLIRQRQEQLTRDFHHLERTDEAVADWAGTRLPDALLTDGMLDPAADRGGAH